MSQQTVVEHVQKPAVRLRPVARPSGTVSVIEPRRTGLKPALREFWQYRRYSWFFGRRFIQKRYVRTWLGVLWLPLRPALSVLSKLLVFGGLVGITAGKTPYALFFLSATAAWQLFSEAALWSTRSLDLNRATLRAVHVPRLVVITSAAVPSLVDFAIHFSFALVGVAYYLLRAPHTFYLEVTLRTPLYAGGGLLIILLLGLGTGLLTAAAGARARDIRFSLMYGLSFAYFFTPVIYPFSQIPNSYKPIAELNPVTGAMELFKVGLFKGNDVVSTKALIVSIGAVVVLWGPGLWLYHRREVPRLVSEQEERDGDVVLSVVGLGKEYSAAHERRYTPATSLFSRIGGRAEIALEYAESTGGEIGDDDDDGDGDDDDDDDEEEEEVFKGGADERFEDVSFEVRIGEAIGIVGTPPSALRSVVRVLGGVTAPSSGRAVAFGRIGLTVELATTLVAREQAPRAAARMLARMAGVPRRQRDEYAEEALRLALGDGSEVTKARVANRRVAMAAALDPYADVLIIDQLPSRGNAGAFRRRCIARLEERLDAGAAVVLAVNDDEVVDRFCSTCVWLEGGKMMHVGPRRAIEVDTDEPPTVAPSTVKRAAGFNRYAAILSVETTDPAGVPRFSFAAEDPVHVAVHVEVAQPDIVVESHVHLIGAGADWVFVQPPRRLGPPGPYDIRLEVPRRPLASGTYELTLALGVTRDERRATLHRLQAIPVTIEGKGRGADGVRVVRDAAWTVAAL